MRSYGVGLRCPQIVQTRQRVIQAQIEISAQQPHIAIQWQFRIGKCSRTIFLRELPKRLAGTGFKALQHLAGFGELRIVKHFGGIFEPYITRMGWFCRSISNFGIFRGFGRWRRFIGSFVQRSIFANIAHRSRLRIDIVRRRIIGLRFVTCAQTQANRDYGNQAKFHSAPQTTNRRAVCANSA